MPNSDLRESVNQHSYLPPTLLNLEEKDLFKGVIGEFTQVQIRVKNETTQVAQEGKRIY